MDRSNQLFFFETFFPCYTHIMNKKRENAIHNIQKCKYSFILNIMYFFCGKHHLKIM